MNADQINSILADPRVYQINRLPAHDDHAFCAAQGRSCHQSLNGKWAFRFAFTPTESFGAWGQIEVPGHIQLQGGANYRYGTPQYVNVQYPWDGHEDIVPGQIPQKYNPVGEYHRRFALPQDWQNCFIRFEGADSALALWCNGSFIGYSESSFNPAEFDLSPAVHGGENELTVRVYRFCSGSWLEDQDFWRMSGLFRPVTLFTKPRTHAENIRHSMDFSPDYRTAAVHFHCDIEGALQGTAKLSFAGQTQTVPLAKELEFDISVDAPRLWSAEVPNLYETTLCLHAADGSTIETSTLQIGLRKFELKDGLLCLNGKRIVFKGVNRHEWSAEHGRAVTREETEWDIINLKRHNVNAVRTCHYPDASFFYDLCDRYGLYVIDETNLETHGTWFDFKQQENILPASRPEWRDNVLDRARSMLERDKNHACVLMWSCGNESNGGKTLFEMHEYFHAADPSRPVHYEGVFWDSTYSDTSDVESQMYTPAVKIAEYLTQHREKPFIMCEYGHAMGNSCGSLEAYTDLTKREPLYQGGFIWEYMEHGLYRTMPDGQRCLAFGGDFGDRPADYEFCIDGLVTATRRNSPKMQAVRGVYQSFDIAVSKEEISITNHNLFTDLADYKLVLRLEQNGRVLQEMAMQQSLAPGGSLTLAQPFPLPDTGCCCVTVLICLRHDEAWAACGHAIAAGQGVFEFSMARKEPAPHTALQVSGHVNLGIRGDNFEYLFNRGNGRLSSLRVDGKELLALPAELNFWRAPTSNDAGSAMPFNLAKWALAGRYAKGTLDAPTTDADGAVTVTAHYTLATPQQEAVIASYKIEPCGACHVRLCWNGGTEEAPEFGLMLYLRQDYAQYRWLGLGPDETMPDRENGALLGLWQGAVDCPETQYQCPQEFSAHTSTRIAVLQGDELPPLCLRKEGTGQNLIFSALPWTPHEVENAHHQWELPATQRTVVRVSAFQRGAGGDDSWGAIPHPAYCYALTPGDTLAFALCPAAPADMDI